MTSQQLREKYISENRSALQQDYENAPDDLKKAMRITLGIMPFMVKSFDDACEMLGVDNKNILPYKNPKSLKRKKANAIVKVNIIAQVLNDTDGYKPDWDVPANAENIYLPYFAENRECGHWFPMPHFKSIEAATHFGNAFGDLCHEIIMM